MRTTVVCLLALGLSACSATVGDLNGFTVFEDACDPSGESFTGQDFDLQFINTSAHLNNTMFGAVQVGTERDVEAVVVISGFDDPNLHVTIPALMPGPPATFAFWMDTNNDGFFTPIPDPDDTGAPPADHQWLRPICPDGTMTFTHTTPFQSVRGARSDGLVFRFLIPPEIQANRDLFNTFRMSVRATRVEDGVRQTRAYYRWSPYVAAVGATPMERVVEVAPPVATSACVTSATECNGMDGIHPADPVCVGMPGCYCNTMLGRCIRNGLPQVTSVTAFQMGGNALGEARGPIDSGAVYEIEFIIDADEDHELGTREDFVCTYMSTAPTDVGTWEFVADISAAAGFCDYPDGFNPGTFSN